MADSEFVQDAIATGGFSRQQALWMEANVAEEGHSHEIEDIDGLEDRLEGSDTDEDDDEG